MSRILLASLAAVAAVAAGCGGGDSGDPATRSGGPAGDAPLAWVGEPTLIRAATGGSDRVVLGDVRNESDKNLQVVAERVEVVDALGKVLDGDARFTNTFSHGLYGPADLAPEDLPPTERSRLGLTVSLEPDGTLPLFASFRNRRTEPPLEIDYGQGTLPIPAKVTDRP